nr:formylglycine-generating enzyme family protein [Paracoccaceae bacterium]
LVVAEIEAIHQASVPTQFYDISRESLADHEGPGHEGWARVLQALATRLDAWADAHPVDPESPATIEKAAQLRAAALEEKRLAAEARVRPPPPTAPHAAPSSPTGPTPDQIAARWARIETSLDPRVYTHFIDQFPTAVEAFDAKLHRTHLEDWAAVDHTSLKAVTGFAAAPSFPALEAKVAAAQADLEAAEEAERLEAKRRRAAALFASPAGTAFRDPLASGGDGPEMLIIPAGSFTMGSPLDEPGRYDWEGPQHQVRIARPFALGKYAVTFDDYDRYAAAAGVDKPEDEGWGRGRRPVINVTHMDADGYCRWLSEQTGAPYRLPSEAEWEYACRAGTTTPYWWGRQITLDQANYSPAGRGKDGRGKTEPVEAFEPNPWGLHQMHGNVWEWCADHWHDSYRGAPTDGSAWGALAALRPG